MLRSVLLSLALAGACAAQPPSRLDRIMPSPWFNPEVERNRLIERYDRTIPLIEDLIKKCEDTLRTDMLTPEKEKSLKEDLVKVRKVLADAKQARQKLIDEGAKAHPVPVAPMPREKRID